VPADGLPVFVLSGAATGLVGSMLGLGGGVFLVPLLTLGLGVPFQAATAASLVSVLATASASASVHMSRGFINLRLGLALAVATSLGGLAGGVAASWLTSGQLSALFAVTAAAMGLLMARRSARRNVIADLSISPGLLGGRLREGADLYVYRARRLPLGFAFSALSGAVSGLLGVGGGVVQVPVLNAFCGIPIRVAAGTSTFMIGVTAAASLGPYLGRGDLRLPLTAAVALGALPGSLLGVRLAEHVHARSLKLLMAAVLIGVAARMGWAAL
jgi:uncharacterized membrane protein YfcA